MKTTVALLVALSLQVAFVPAHSQARVDGRPLAAPADESWRRADIVLDALDVNPGETVVDLGAGSGYYVGPLANLVGRRGTVYATDIDDASLRGLEGLKAAHGFSQMIIVRSEHHSARLPASSVDAVLLSHTLRELKQPVQFLADLKGSLKRNGRLVIVDFHHQDDGFVPPKASRLDVAEAKRIVDRAGFWVSEIREMPRQYLLICSPK